MIIYDLDPLSQQALKRVAEGREQGISFDAWGVES
ncbi:hypothetical protein HDC93_006806 [Streptomyces sp. AK010]|nr:hypothetical protein [Streptomyces sp. AK010]